MESFPSEGPYTFMESGAFALFCFAFVLTDSGIDAFG
jgi:hypothetical protein